MLNGGSRFALVAIAFLSTACGGPSESDRSLGRSRSASGGSCGRDLEALSNLIFQPVACSATAQCPTGAHCDAERLTCDWECFSDTDCGAGNECTCDGYCQGPNLPIPPFETGEPSCDRERATLVALSTTVQACVFDEDCPFGARCDPARRECTATCYGTVDEDEARDCDGGLVCNCRGECVDPAAAPSPLPRELPAAELTPTIHYLESGEDGGSRTSELKLRWFPPPGATVAAAPQPTVQVVPMTPGAFVTCDGQNWVDDECSFDTTPAVDPWVWDWQLDEADGSYTAGTGTNLGIAGPSQSTWTAHVYAPGMVPSFHTLELRPYEPPPPLEGRYVGSIERRSNSVATRISVDAWVRQPGGAGTPLYLLLADATRTISASGKLLVRLDADSPELATWLQSPSGDMVAKVERIGAYSLASGTLKGSFNVYFSPGDLQDFPDPVYTQTGERFGWNYELRWERALRTQAGEAGLDTCDVWSAPQTPCLEDGASCNEGINLCEQGDPHVRPAAFVNDYVEPRYAAWRSAINEVFAALGQQIDLWAEDIYGFDTGFKNIPYLERKVVGAERLRQSPDLGFRLCTRDWPPGIVDPATHGSCPALGLPSNAPDCEYMYSFATCEDPTLYRNDYVPCATDIPDPPAAQAPVDIDTFLPKAVKCRDLHAVSDTGLDYATWLAGSTGGIGCRATEEQVSNAGLNFKVYLCPFEDALLDVDARWFADDPPRDRWECFSPSEVAAHTVDGAGNAWGTPFFDGQRELLDTVGLDPWYVGSAAGDPISGESTCPDGWADRMSPVLQYKYLVTVPLSAGSFAVPSRSSAQLLDRCLEELGGKVPSVAGFGTLTAAGIMGALFPKSECFSPGRFHAGFEGLYQSMNVDFVNWLAYRDRWRRWFMAHSFVASQALNEEGEKIGGDLDLFSAQIGQTVERESRAADLDDVLSVLESSWGPVLAAERLQELHVDTGAVPLWLDRPNPDHEQDLYLDTHMVEAMSVELRVLIRWLEERSPRALDRCAEEGSAEAVGPLLQVYGRFLRIAYIIQALAREDREHRLGYLNCDEDSDCVALNSKCLPTQICDGASNPPFWANRHLASMKELGGVMREAAQLAGRLRDCRSTVDPANGDVPLYFGDVVGTSSRYFASSDYLLNTWAAPAIASAQQALAESRRAWLDRRNAGIQDEQNEQDRERRIEAIRRSYGSRIIEICGFTEFESKDVFDAFHYPNPWYGPESCFAAPSCIGSETPSAECYRGLLGGAKLKILAASADYQESLRASEAATYSYGRKFTSCMRAEASIGSIESLNAKFQAEMSALSEKLEYYERTAVWINGATKAARDIFIGIATGGTASVLGGAAVAGGDLASAYFESEKVGVEKDIRDAVLEHDLAVQSRRNDIMTEQCWAEVDSEYAKIAAADARVVAALAREMVAFQEVADLEREVGQKMDEGNAVAGREEERIVPSLAHHQWFDEKVERFRREFSWAKRLTHLALRAVEYEFQQSLSTRQLILGAEHPDELELALRELQREQAARTINGRRPEESSLVLSLRDDILALADRQMLSAEIIDDDPEAARSVRAWTPARRFAERVGSADHAVWRDGQYMGQAIPFVLRERGALRLRCGERLWRVTATIQGDLPGYSEPYAPAFLYKSNLGWSSWCNGMGDGSAHQVATVNPSANLFRPAASGGTEAFLEPFVAAMMTPWFNVPRSQFYKLQYREGASEELAGRPLYGDYVLFLPYHGLLSGEGDGVPFPLDRIEDVLIRFDFLSVDNIPQN